MVTQEKSIKKIVTYKERDYNGVIGELQFWEESDENLESSVSISGYLTDIKHNVTGLHLGQLRFNTKNVTPKMAKKIAKVISKALGEISNPKVKQIIIPN